MHSRSIPETSRKSNGGREKNEVCFRNNLEPEVSIFSTFPLKVRIRKSMYFVTGVTGENSYCLPEISSGEQKKVRSSTLPQIRNADTLEANEAVEIILALQQLAGKSANCSININRGSKLLMSLATTMTSFDEKLRHLLGLKTSSRQAPRYLDS